MDKADKFRTYRKCHCHHVLDGILLESKSQLLWICFFPSVYKDDIPIFHFCEFPRVYNVYIGFSMLWNWTFVKNGTFRNDTQQYWKCPDYLVLNSLCYEKTHTSDALRLERSWAAPGVVFHGIFLLKLTFHKCMKVIKRLSSDGFVGKFHSCCNGMLSSKVAVFVKKAPWKIDGIYGIFKFRIFKWPTKIVRHSL